MIRLNSFVLVLLLFLALPAGLVSQSSSSHRLAIVASPAEESCFAAAFGFPGAALPGVVGEESHGFNLSNLDRSVSPCDDFFKFADGGWIKNNPIPADHSSWATFNQLHDKNEDVLRAILDEAAKDKAAEAGSNWQKIGDYYASCMDESQIETAGLKPLDPELQRIAEIKDAAGLQAEIARLQREGANAVFGFGSEQDFKDSTRVIADAEQGGLGLPDRQYYRDNDDRSKKLRDEYVEHVTNMFKLTGDDAGAGPGRSKSGAGHRNNFGECLDGPRRTSRPGQRVPQNGGDPVGGADAASFMGCVPERQVNAPPVSAT